MRRLIDHLPLLLAFLAGGALLIVGAATRPDVSNDWLAFAGSMLGTGLAALVGYWIVRDQERRRFRTNRDVAIQAVEAVRRDFQTILDEAEGKTLFKDAVSVARVRGHGQLLQTISSQFATTDLPAYLAVETVRVHMMGDWDDYFAAIGAGNMVMTAGWKPPAQGMLIPLTNVIRECGNARDELRR